MILKVRDARFLADTLRPSIALRQRLELSTSHGEPLSLDDIDRLLELCRSKLPEIKFDDKGNPTEAGRVLGEIIEILRYS